MKNGFGMSTEKENCSGYGKMKMKYQNQLQDGSACFVPGEIYGRFCLLRSSGNFSGKDYWQQLGRENEALYRKCPDLANRKSVILCHECNKVTLCKRRPRKNKVVRWRFTSRSHFPYSSDLVTNKILFVSITRTFCKRQNVQKQRKKVGVYHGRNIVNRMIKRRTTDPTM